MSATYAARISSLVNYLTTLALIGGTAHGGVAEVILPDLPVSSKYQLIFVTQGKLTPSSSNIATYNQFVTDEAALNPQLPDTTWHAVASVPGVDALTNAPSTGVPVYNTQAILVSPAEPDLYNWSAGGVLNPILYDQFGIAYNPGPSSDALVWTGTDRFGVGRSGSRLGESSTPGVGSAKYANTQWVVQAYGVADTPYPIYALSDPITVLPNQGDYNRDGTVDAADYVHWRDLIGHVVEPCSGPDANCNGFVEFDENQPWRENFGRVYDGGDVESGLNAGAAKVPEPATLALFLCACLCCGRWRQSAA